MSQIPKQLLDNPELETSICSLHMELIKEELKDSNGIVNINGQNYIPVFDFGPETMGIVNLKLEKVS